MRLTAIFPLLCSLIALILAFLTVFAGSNHDMMERYDLLTLNTSRIGLDFFNTTKISPASLPSNSTSWLGSLVHNATAEIKNATNNFENEIEKDLNKAFRSLAKDLGIYDFYSVHVLDHCQGYFYNGTGNRNVSGCSNSTGLSTFSPTQTLQKQLDASHINVTLSELHFPDAIEKGVNALKLAFNITFVLYCIGITFTGLALLGAAFGLFADGRMSALLNIGLSGLSFLTLMIASAIVTYAATKIVHIINKEGKIVNINAQRGDRYLSLTWTATVLMFIAGIAWCFECMVGRRREKMTPKQYQ